jgi:hypothetical protein
MATQTWDRDTLDALKKLADDIEFIMTNYYPHYSPELDEKLGDVKYSLEDEIDRLKKVKWKGLEKVM